MTNLSGGITVWTSTIRQHLIINVDDTCRMPFNFNPAEKTTTSMCSLQSFILPGFPSILCDKIQGFFQASF